MDILTYCLTYCLLTQQHFPTQQPQEQIVTSQDQSLIVAQAPFLNQTGKKAIPIDEAEVNPDFLEFRQQFQDVEIR